ncbi:hypothetical protein GX51_00483 [Blastomyces parvus]|uniref:Uncharacterized protein n=1 Tax=Blastomyces parvus TaxID=2060905 RepID=A0A2B7XKV9_9EURO|nr:hypothetical protein GX51_00483 [Blastomyces parvus]
MSQYKDDPNPKLSISRRNHQSHFQGDEFNFIRAKLYQWFPQSKKFVHQNGAISFIDGKPADNPQRTIIIRFQCSVVMRIQCMKEGKEGKDLFEEALTTLLRTRASSDGKQFRAIVVGSQIKFLQDHNGYVTGLGGEEAESVRAIDFNTEKGASKAEEAVARIIGEFMGARKIVTKKAHEHSSFFEIF